MTDHYSCVVLDDYLSSAFTYADWSVLYPHVRYRALTKHISEPEVLVSHIKDCQILVLFNEDTPITEHVIARLPNLKLIIVHGARNRAVDYAAAQAKGIIVWGTEKEKYPIVELTWSLILALARDIPKQNLSEDQTIEHVQTMGTDLHGKILGIVGLNSVASNIIPIAGVFGMDVIVFAPELSSDEAAGLGCRKVDSLTELLEVSDFVSIHTELNQDSYHLINAEALAHMKKTAFLINTSRNGIVDTEALIKCVQEEDIRGAAVDVFDVEPLELYEKVSAIPRLIATPHLGYVTEQSYANFFTQAVDNIERFLQERLLTNTHK